MKEIKKLSELVNLYISDVSKKMQEENKDVRIYDVWEQIKINEKLPFSASLEDVKNSCIVVRVEHPGVAQQLRIKKNNIIKTFNEKCTSINLKNIKIIVESRLR